MVCVATSAVSVPAKMGAIVESAPTEMYGFEPKIAKAIDPAMNA